MIYDIVYCILYNTYVYILYNKYIYIYIYICVCVCVLMFSRQVDHGSAWLLRRATVESARPQFSNSMLQPRSNGKDFRSSALVRYGKSTLKNHYIVQYSNNM